MARITVEDCLTHETNRFALVLLAAKRTKQLLAGAKLLVAAKNKPVVNALREIAAGEVRFMTEEDLALQREKEEAEREAALAQSEALALARPESVTASLGAELFNTSDSGDSPEPADTNGSE